MIKVNEINIRKIKEKNGVVAISSCVLQLNEYAFYLDKIGIVIKQDNTYRLSFPKYNFGEQKLNYYHPINKPTMALLETAIIVRYLRLEEATNEIL